MSNPDTSTRIIGSTGTNRLRRIGLLAAALGALVASSANAGPQLGTIEECLESGTDLVSLPGVPGGTLSAKGCATCETLRLTFDQQTSYFIGKEAVPYSRLLAAVKKGPQTIYVFYRPETRALS
ncbi:MAG: hypothetical protein WEC00_04630, partial [Dongiaceae bacterium]